MYPRFAIVEKAFLHNSTASCHSHRSTSIPAGRLLSASFYSSIVFSLAVAYRALCSSMDPGIRPGIFMVLLGEAWIAKPRYVLQVIGEFASWVASRLPRGCLDPFFSPCLPLLRPSSLHSCARFLLLSWQKHAFSLSLSLFLCSFFISPSKRLRSSSFHLDTVTYSNGITCLLPRTVPMYFSSLRTPF